MKNKILNIIFAILTLFVIIFTLTACSFDKFKKEDDEKNNEDIKTAEGAIEAYVNAINDHDVDAILELIDLDSYNELADFNKSEKELKKELKSFFKENDDFKVELKKVTALEDDDDVMEEIEDIYDSADEYIEELEDEYGVKGLEIYVAKIKLPKDFEKYYEYKDLKKDVVLLIKTSGKYKIVSTSISFNIYNDEISNLEYEEETKTSNTKNDIIDVDEYNAKVKKYEGSIDGKTVKELIDEVISLNNKYSIKNNIRAYVNYYAEGGMSIEDTMCYAETQLKEVKNKIDNSHKYTIKIEENDDGYLTYISVYYNEPSY